MLQTIYVSSASSTFSYAELGDLLRQSRENNQSKHVSGMLFYYKASFLQVLEGPEEDVQGLVRAIAADDRHGHFKILSSELVERKMFGDLTMGFVEAGHVANLVEEYTGTDTPFPLLSLDAGQAREMLKFFRQVVSNDMPLP